MVNSTCSSAANLLKLLKSVISIEMFCTLASFAVPALPGATNTFSTLSDCAHFHARACSLPPDPIINTFIRLSLHIK